MAGSGASSTVEGNAPVAEPWQWLRGLRAERFDQCRQVAFLLQRDRKELGVELDIGSGFERRFEQRLGRAVAIARRQLQCQQAVEVVGQHGHDVVEIDLDDHRGRQPVEAEEAQLCGDGLFDEPAAGVAAQQAGQGRVEVIGDQQGGPAGPVQDGDLADRAVVVEQ